MFNITPTAGKKLFTYAVLGADKKELKSSVGIFNVQILNIDFDNKKVIVQVSRKS